MMTRGTRRQSPGTSALLAEAATKPPREDTLSKDGNVEAGAYNEGSDVDEAAASAVRRAYTASGTVDDPKATAAAVRRARMARAAVRMAKAHRIGNGARNKGSGDDKVGPVNEAAAMAERRTYVASAAANDNEAAASAARRARATMAA